MRILKKEVTTHRFDFLDTARAAIRVKISPIQQRSIFHFPFILYFQGELKRPNKQTEWGYGGGGNEGGGYIKAVCLLLPEAALGGRCPWLIPSTLIHQTGRGNSNESNF